jgi:hypothetical protein
MQIFKELVHSLHVGIRGHLTLECVKLCNFIPKVLQGLLLFFQQTDGITCICHANNMNNNNNIEYSDRKLSNILKVLKIKVDNYRKALRDTKIS